METTKLQIQIVLLHIKELFCQIRSLGLIVHIIIYICLFRQ